MPNDDDQRFDNEVATTSAAVDFSALPAMLRAEIDVQIATARRFPRDVRAVMATIRELATIDEATAEECLYVLVRGQKKPARNGAHAAAASPSNDRENKPIEGPSIRLAEIAAQVYGNCRTASRVIEVNRKEMYVEAEGIFHDLQTNAASRSTVRRRISTRNGSIFSDDMIIVTGNAAGAIAKRNAILSGIPRSLYRPAYEEARRMIAGTKETLIQNRDLAFKHFATKGITPDQLLTKLGIGSVDEITPDHIASMRGLWATIKNGDESVEDMFSTKAAEHDAVKDPLSDKAPVDADDAGGDAKPASGADDSSEAKASDPEPSATTGKKGTGPKAKAAAKDDKPLTPYSAGRAAYAAGKSRDDVPAGWAGTEDGEIYQDGWDDAHGEAAKEAKVDDTFPGDRK